MARRVSSLTRVRPGAISGHPHHIYTTFREDEHEKNSRANADHASDGRARTERIDGTWKIDLNKAQMDTKPMVYELKDGMYSCSTCDPKISIKADGRNIRSRLPYVDSEKITR